MARIGLRSLSARLTLQFALLFAGAMLALAVALSFYVSRSAQRSVANELQASGAVYDRLWAQRAHEMQNAATLLARDYGFRAAVASGDEATMRSALGNAASRLSVNSAYIVTADGHVYALEGMLPEPAARRLFAALDEGQVSGVGLIGGKPRELVAAPIMAPTLIGWIVFAPSLGADDLRALEKLSAIPIQSSVLLRGVDGSAKIVGSLVGLRPAAIDTVERYVGGTTFDMEAGGDAAIALARPLRSFDAGEQAALLLTYPKDKALADARRLQWIIGLASLVGLALVAYATWKAADRIAQPVRNLDQAAARLADGELAVVPEGANDELGNLAKTFNRMAGEIIERERRITQLAFNDPLTGLPNRSMFHQQLDRLLGAANNGGAPFALFCLDLDHFKNVNDTLGHPAGDQLLVEVARRVTGAAKNNFVARLGGDEFVVLHPIEGPGSIDRLSHAIIAAVGKSHRLDGQEVVPSTSIGIAIAPADAQEAGSLLKGADLALYRAKSQGRGSYAFYEEKMNAQAQARHRMETDLRVALTRDELVLEYQPLFDLEKDKVCSLEALIRWNHPARGRVSPAEFIPVAEDMGLIVAIGEWTMRTACTVAATWPADIRVAVNVSSIEFHRGSLQQSVKQALATSGLDPRRLELEITESVFLEGSEPTLKQLHELRALGIRIALDDFGTGYSSLSYLQSFPFDKLKIDRSFIQNLLERDGASAIVRAITDLARALGIETTAEGVEETAQLMELRAHGCSSIQGFLLSSSMTEEAVSRMFAGPEALKFVA